MIRTLKRLLRRGRVWRDMRQELRDHVELEMEDRVRAGLTPAEARRTTLRDAGAGATSPMTVLRTD